MDSGNSESSSQSTSSCGDGNEYDSRAAVETISPSLLNTLPNLHLITPNQQPPQHHHHQHPPNLPSSIFDHLTNFHNVNPLVNFDMAWPKSDRSDPNCTDLVGLMQAPPVPNPGQNMSAGYALIQQGCADTHDLTVPPNSNNNTLTTTTTITAATTTTTTTTTTTSNANSSLLPVRNAKKRSRASRRAPTTVLTTDTSNFRAMVQEFTGIPSPPFTSSAFARGRLDLFTTNPFPLRRPMAQKIQKNPLSLSTPFVSRISSDTMIDALALISPTTPRKDTFSNPVLVNNYQLPPSSLVENTNMPNNPVLNLQSLVQQGPIKFPLSNSVFIGSKNQGPVDQDVPASVQSHGNVGNNIFEELGLSHGGNVITTQQQSNRNDQGLLGLLNGDYGDSDHHQGISNGKINCSNSSATGFRGDNNVNARTEGMVESWIRSSD